VATAQAYLIATGAAANLAEIRDFLNEVIRSLGIGRTLATESIKSSNLRPAGPVRHYEGDVLRVTPRRGRGADARNANARGAKGRPREDD
jgi:hypothetical protein